MNEKLKKKVFDTYIMEWVFLIILAVITYLVTLISPAKVEFYEGDLTLSKSFVSKQLVP